MVSADVRENAWKYSCNLRNIGCLIVALDELEFAGEKPWLRQLENHWATFRLHLFVISGMRAPVICLHKIEFT